nr:MAG TPA: PORTAL PROTEIN [Caudoviricetes sp.]
MTKVRINNKRLLTVPVNTEVTAQIVTEAIRLHLGKLVPTYRENENLYLSDHKILHAIAKDTWKPDNRLVINYAKYIVDMFNGYFIGIPATVSHDDQVISDYVNDFRKYNDMEDSESELSKLVDIFGHAFWYVYQDEDANTRVTYNSPMNILIVHDNSVAERPKFAVRYMIDEETGTGTGEVVTDTETIYFTLDNAGDVSFGERTNHIYSKLPIIEVIENEERRGIFESVKTLLNALNKAVSEKANDVDYFADAYLKIIGMELDDEVSSSIRDNRVFNLWGESGSQLDVDFLQKPNADQTQENLIVLLRDAIFNISMVANLSDKDFGNSSGTALAYKLQAMDNLAKSKDRKMQSGFNRLYEVVLSVPTTQVPADAWSELNYKFTRNVPKNTLEEAQIVSQLNGQVSDETKLSVLSIVQDPKEELERMEEESKKDSALYQQMALNERMSDFAIAEGTEEGNEEKDGIENDRDRQKE